MENHPQHVPPVQPIAIPPTNNSPKPKNKLPLILAVIVLLLFVGGAYYFRAKDNTSATIQNSGEKRFTGTITEVNTGCWSDGTCSLRVDNTWIITEYGGLTPNGPTLPEGKLIGFSFRNDVHTYIGRMVEVYAKDMSDGKTLTIYGSPNYYVKLLQETTSTPVPPSYKTTKLAIYTNTLYGFSIQIPARWYLYPATGKPDGTPASSDTFTATNYDLNDSSNFHPSGQGYSSKVKNPLGITISIVTYEKATLSDLKKRYQSEVGKDVSNGGDTGPIQLVSVTDSTFAGYPALKVRYDTQPLDTIVFVNNKRYTFMITFSGSTNLTEESNKKILDQILSTFKLIQ